MTKNELNNGEVIEETRDTANAVTLVAESGVTIKSKGGSLAISVQNGKAVLEKLATDVWLLSGSI